jgi:hypothetical protein
MKRSVLYTALILLWGASLSLAQDLEMVGICELPYWVNEYPSICINGNYAFVNGRDYAGNYRLDYFPTRLCIHNNYLLIAKYHLTVAEISDPVNPITIAEHADDFGETWDEAADDQFIYANGNDDRFSEGAFEIFRLPALGVNNNSSKLPQNMTLSSYPNPFNPATTISFTLPSAGQARLEVFDILGRNVKTLADRKFEAGEHAIVWDGTDENGIDASSGVYFYRLSTDGCRATQKMVLLR